MTTPLYLLAVVLGCVSLSSCAQVADSLVSSMIDSAFDSHNDFEKNAVRSHLRHGDTVEEAKRGAVEDRFFMEMERDAWLE